MQNCLLAALKTNQVEIPDGRMYLETCTSSCVDMYNYLFSLHFSQFQKDKTISKSFLGQKRETLLPQCSMTAPFPMPVVWLGDIQDGSHKVDGWLESHSGPVIIFVLCTEARPTFGA